MNQLSVILLAVLLVVCVAIGSQLYLNNRRLRARYAPIIDLDSALATVKEQLSRAKHEQQAFASEHERQRAQLTREYEQARKTYAVLKKEISLLEENLEDISFGLYKPHFSFQTSAEYKAKLEMLRNHARQLIRNGSAAECTVQWTVGGSGREGARMAKQNTKLVLRAFNGECDAALAKVSWNNIVQMEERIRKSFHAINQLGTVMQVTITEAFLRLKLDELRLTYEYEEKRYQEQEEQRRIREQMREEEKAQREIEKAREDAEREEARFAKALEKARAEAARATGERLQELNDRIQSLEAQLGEAHTQKERAIARAQLTKSGYVYVISNVGSFGEDVYKVGMTRRLDPMDRIRELGGASVPFQFDVHAMLYSENAPELESALHQFLSKRRVNLVNPRKEFFRITLEEVEKFAKEQGLKVEFTQLAEAKEYRETLARWQEHVMLGVQEAEKFPSSLFADGGSLQTSKQVDG